ncbi:MAG TPA: cupin domain-containing protein [Steroidobacteraceae bacterium]
MGKRLDLSVIKTVTGSRYPAPFDQPCRSRQRQRLGDAAALTQFGVNLLRLPAGAWSSQRHWHTHEDEFIYVLSGEVTLLTEQGEELLRAGDTAGFKAGEQNGHSLQNRSAAEAMLLEIGSRTAGDVVHYPDIDLVARAEGAGAAFTHRDGTPYR